QMRLGGNPASFTPDQLTLNKGTLRSTATFALDDSNRGITIGASGGTFNVGPSNVLTLPNPVTGSGSANSSGPGTLVLSGANTFSARWSALAGVLVAAATTPLATNTITAANIPVLALSGGPAENISMSVTQAFGNDWDTGADWSDGNPASVSAVSNPGSTYTILPGATMRTPAGASDAFFPGNVLTNRGDGV